MQETLDIVVGILQENGGSMEWSALMEQVPFEYRARVPDALKIGKSTGVTRREIRFENGENLHTVNLVS